MVLLVLKLNLQEMLTNKQIEEANTFLIYSSW